MHVQETNPKGKLCMYKGPILWGHNACTKVCTEGCTQVDHFYGEKMHAHWTIPKGKQCTYKGMYKVDQSYEDMTMHVQYKGMYKGPILWGQEACTKV